MQPSIRMSIRLAGIACLYAVASLLLMGAPAAAQSGAKPTLDSELQNAIATAPHASDFPNSNYARLLDLANVTVQADGSVVSKFRMTYKLFNERDRDRLAEVNIPYNSGQQSIRILSARTIRKDGTVVPVKQSDIRVSSPYSEYLMYDDALAMSFSMPAIEDDCVIDYTWELTTHPMMKQWQFTQFWGFSGFEPVGISRIVLHIPADKHIQYRVYNDAGLKPVTVTSVDGKIRTYTWERTNIKPLVSEPSMPRSEEVNSWLEISSLDSWQDIAKWFWSLQHPQAKSTPAIQATVDQLTKGKVSDDDKARAIYYWVARRTRYVGVELGISAYKPHAAADVHNKLYGDCKDKATLLITMLGQAGIKAHPVFLHTDERKPTDEGLPTLTAFDHCIALAEVGGKDVWLDATAETCPYGDIPAADRGVRALVVKDGTGVFKTIPTYDPKENSTAVISRVAIQPDGSASIDMSIEMSGETGQEIRAAVKARTPDQRREMVQKMAQEFSTGASLESFSLPEDQTAEGPYVLKLKLSAPNFAKKVGKLLIMPLEVGSGSRRQTNPFVSEKRTWPIVEETASQARSETVFVMPDGFRLEAAPDAVKSSGVIQEYERTLSQSGDGKQVTVVSTVTAKPGKAPATDYGAIRGYYQQVLKSAEDLMVLRKD